MYNSWIEETLGLIRVWEEKHQKLRAKREELEEEMGMVDGESEQLDQKILTAHSLIQDYKEKHNIGMIAPFSNISNILASKSYPEILTEIAKKEGGLFTADNTIEFLLQAGFNKNKRAIQANVYSALGRMVRNNKFVKIKPGVYRYLNHARKESNGKPSGIRQAVKELKEKNPQMTKNEVLNYLIKSSFDFKGKKPTSAVNITWAYLGYSKEGKQPSLPLVN